MQRVELYLPIFLPLWAIFIGIALVIMGFVDKKASFTYSGWSVLMANGLISLYYNLFQINPAHFFESPLKETATVLVTAGWLNVAGSFLALASLLFFYLKNKRYLLIAALTILFFAVQFFQFYALIQKPK